MRYSILVVAVGFMAVAGIDGRLGVATDQPDPPTLQLAQINDHPDQARRHFRVRDPADLTAIEAEEIYREFSSNMAKVYAISGDALAAAYQKWPRYNSAPYLSKTHGQRYANNFTNRLAAGYGAFEDADTLPVGALVAKDSFAVTASGEIFPSPLFLMEKMTPGFSNASGDWRCTMIMPDGAIFGTTPGRECRAGGILHWLPPGAGALRPPVLPAEGLSDGALGLTVYRDADGDHSVM